MREERRRKRCTVTTDDQWQWSATQTRLEVLISKRLFDKPPCSESETARFIIERSRPVLLSEQFVSFFFYLFAICFCCSFLSVVIFLLFRSLFSFDSSIVCNSSNSELSFDSFFRSFFRCLVFCILWQQVVSVGSRLFLLSFLPLLFQEHSELTCTTEQARICLASKFLCDRYIEICFSERCL